ncbi:hypothetical protein TW65_04663 [Stemphylium lycopersici]|nr:hypothetical protein TW65_04663 [Stemphylium lycopersici]
MLLMLWMLLMLRMLLILLISSARMRNVSTLTKRKDSERRLKPVRERQLQKLRKATIANAREERQSEQ